MKIGRTGLRMSDGTIRHFTSEAHRDAFERVAEAIKHGWRPTHKRNESRGEETESPRKG